MNFIFKPAILAVPVLGAFFAHLSGRVLLKLLEAISFYQYSTLSTFEVDRGDIVSVYMPQPLASPRAVFSTSAASVKSLFARLASVCVRFWCPCMLYVRRPVPVDPHFVHATISIDGSKRFTASIHFASRATVSVAVFSLPAVLLKLFAARFAIEMSLCARLLSLVMHPTQATCADLSIAPVNCAYFTLITAIFRRFTEPHHISSACTTRTDGV